MEKPAINQKYSFEKKLTRMLQAVFVVSSVALMIYQVLQGSYIHVLRCMLFPLFLLIPQLFRWMRLAVPWRLCVCLYLFSLFAFSYGCVYGAFAGAEISDKISHFFSGTLFTIFGMCMYFVGADGVALDKRPWLPASYGLFFSIFVAVMWEVIEFFDFTLLGNDSQHHLTTGVFDTMYDLMSCLVASLLSAGSYLLWRKKGLKLLTAWVMEEFCDVNVIKRM